MADISKIKLPNGSTYDISDANAIKKPSSAIAGDALVYDGSDWTKQDGYGYSAIGTNFFPSTSYTLEDAEEYYVTETTYSGSDLVVGNLYCVTFNNIQYTLEATTFDTGTYKLGECTTSGEPIFTNYPFVFVENATASSPGMLLMSNVANVTIKIDNISVVKINDKYLPTQNIFIAEYGTTSMSEIIAAANNNKYILLSNGEAIVSSFQYGGYSSRTGKVYFYRRDFDTASPLHLNLYLQTITVEDSTWTMEEQTDEFIERADSKVTSLSSSSTDIEYPSAKCVYDAIAALPTPMVFKGTLGTGGTITSLPTASSSNSGWTYKVITAGTYASQAAKVGDLFISNGSSWVYVPSGDDTYTDTWRGIKVNDTLLLGNGISSGDVNFKAGANVTLSGSGNDITIAATDTTYESKTAAESGTDVSLVTTGEKYTWNQKNTVSVSATGSATDEVSYITVDSVEKKLPSGSTVVLVDETYENAISNIDATPIECSTDAEMTAALTSANVGKLYKFTGTTGTYINGDYYMVVEEA